ncbi:MAG: hypothetical protein Q8L48_19825 [Archangium sp.]|nr:hypothetical protein [Archangium sp.]
MRRLWAAMTPMAFFTGLALLCASLTELARWPFISLRLQGSDFGVDWESTWSPPFIEAADEQFGVSHLAQVWFGGVVLLSLLGLWRLWKGHQGIGAALIAVAALASPLPLVVLSARLRLSDPMIFGYGCHGPYAPTLPFLLEQTLVVAALVAVVGTIGWLVSQRLRRLPLGPGTWVAAGITLSLLGVALLSSAAAASLLTREALTEILVSRGELVEPARPLVWLLLLWTAGLVLSLTRPLYVSRLVSLLVLLAGSVSVAPALAVAHDSEAEAHPMLVSPPPDDLITPTTSWCPTLQLGLVVQMSRTEVMVGGRTLARPTDAEGTEAALFKELSEQHQQVRELYAQAGAPEEEHVVNLLADEGTPFTTIAAVGRAVQRAEYRVINLVALLSTPGGTWVVPTVHNHSCALRVELSPGGTPIADFADFPSLFRAAEEARGTLRVQLSP